MQNKIGPKPTSNNRPKRPNTAERKQSFIQTHTQNSENPYKILADCQYDIIASTTFEEDGLSETIRLGFQNVRGISRLNLYWCEGDSLAIRPYQTYLLNSKYEIIGKNLREVSRIIGFVVKENLLAEYLRCSGISNEKGLYGSIMNGEISLPFGICWNKKEEIFLIYDLNPYNKAVLKADKDELKRFENILEMPSGVIVPLLYKKSLQGVMEITGNNLYFDGNAKNADSLVKYTTFMARVLAIHKKMQTDPLTRLLSKEAFEYNLDKKIWEYLEFGKPFSLLYLDGDDFKKINDTYGHAVGDKVLRNIAKQMFESTLPQDLNHRIGGEEFAIITPVPLHTAIKIAQRVARNMREPVHVTLKPDNGEEVVVSKTVCIGVVDVATVACLGNGNINEIAAGMKKLADTALYRAKAEPGKGSIYAVVLENGLLEYKKID
ncbi:MAG: GGDEF domain-containing protein [Candidatus Micrarchaeia archaeon]